MAPVGAERRRPVVEEHVQADGHGQDAAVAEAGAHTHEDAARTGTVPQSAATHVRQNFPASAGLANTVMNRVGRQSRAVHCDESCWTSVSGRTL